MEHINMEKSCSIGVRCDQFRVRKQHRSTNSKFLTLSKTFHLIPILINFYLFLQNVKKSVIFVYIVAIWISRTYLEFLLVSVLRWHLNGSDGIRIVCSFYHVLGHKFLACHWPGGILFSQYILEYLMMSYDRIALDLLLSYLLSWQLSESTFMPIDHIIASSRICFLSIITSRAGLHIG